MTNRKLAQRTNPCTAESRIGNTSTRQRIVPCERRVSCEVTFPTSLKSPSDIDRRANSVEPRTANDVRAAFIPRSFSYRGNSRKGPCPCHTLADRKREPMAPGILRQRFRVEPGRTAPRRLSREFAKVAAASLTWRNACPRTKVLSPQVGKAGAQSALPAGQLAHWQSVLGAPEVQVEDQFTDTIGTS